MNRPSQSHYTAPTIEAVGDVADLTRGAATGERADKILNVGDLATFLS